MQNGLYLNPSKLETLAFFNPGVPQGSVLGYLLIVLFISQIGGVIELSSELSNNCFFHQYADNINILIHKHNMLSY